MMLLFTWWKWERTQHIDPLSLFLRLFSRLRYLLLCSVSFCTSGTVTILMNVFYSTLHALQSFINSALSAERIVWKLLRLSIFKSILKETKFRVLNNFHHRLLDDRFIHLDKLMIWVCLSLLCSPGFLNNPFLVLIHWLCVQFQLE